VNFFGRHVLQKVHIIRCSSSLRLCEQNNLKHGATNIKLIVQLLMPRLDYKLNNFNNYVADAANSPILVVRRQSQSLSKIVVVLA